MVTVSEVIVGLKSEGAKQTEKDMEGVKDKTEQTTDALDDQSDEMTGLAQKVSGALGAVVTGLTVAAAGLLSQVPVIGEVGAGLESIVDSLALKIDETLRPTLSDVSDDLFGVSEDVDNAEGSFDALKTAFFGVRNAFQTNIIEDIQKKIEDLTGITIPQDWLDFGWDLITLDFIGMYNRIKNDLQDIGDKAGNWISGVIEDMKAKGEEFKNKFDSKIKTPVTNFIDDMKQKGKNMIDEFISGIKAKGEDAEQAVEDLMSKVDAKLPGSPADEGPLSDLDEAGPGLVNEFAGGITSNLGQLQSAGSQAADAADGRGQGGELPGARNTTTKVFLNGREVGRGTNSERFDESARRGQTF